MRWVGRLRRLCLGIAPREVRFERRGFALGDARARAHLESVGLAFLRGYHHALERSEPRALAGRLEAEPPALSGFAFEGAAMALTLLDRLSRGRRFERFLSGPGAAHDYMLHVGAGWALARLGRGGERPPRFLDELLGWLAFDGYGFHEGYFRWPRTVVAQRLPRLRGYALRAFDQGLGRSLWFVEGARAQPIARTVARFPHPRRSDLWSGVGLAATYAAGCDAAELAALRREAADFGPCLAQGAAFAAEARSRARIPTPATEQACELLCGLSAERAAEVARTARRSLPPDGAEPAYEVWRRRIQGAFAQRVAA